MGTDVIDIHFKGFFLCRLATDGFQVGVAALWFDGVDVQLFKEVGVAHREDELGNDLGKQIREALDAAGRPTTMRRCSSSTTRSTAPVDASR